MRQSGIPRLSSLQLDKNERDYIVMRHLIDDLRPRIAEFANGDVLDVGCGNKPYEELFTNTIRSYTGCDVTQSNMCKVDVICPATQLIFDDNYFNTVFSTQVMEHVEDPGKMLKECFRVLKPGGFLILSIPFCWELHEEPYDFYRFSKYGMAAMLEKEGFAIIEIKANGGKWAAIFQLNLNIIYSVFRRKGLFPKLLKFLFRNLHFTEIINRLSMWLDRKFHDELLTLNYVVIGTKK